jgi:hypothetical protein
MAPKIAVQRTSVTSAKLSPSIRLANTAANIPIRKPTITPMTPPAAIFISRSRDASPISRAGAGAPGHVTGGPPTALSARASDAS